MPLPPALAARLAKRGLIVQEKEKQEEEPKVPEKVPESVGSTPSSHNPDEEVFAEDYDDPNAVNLEPPPPVILPVQLPPPLIDSDDEEIVQENLVYETSACPNLSNKYHECSAFCKEHWGVKKFKHPLDLEKKHKRLLNRYPLPDGWFEVGDPTTGRYFYWNADTDLVSWMPPTHPRTSITVSANKLKASLPSLDVTEQVEELGATVRDEPPMEEEEFEEPDFEEMERELLKEKKKREKSKGRSSSRRERKKGEEALDPMDPASYSDIARGGWTAGLDIPGSAKTGVDSTVSGPLFQQRPYPSPGAVLRANAGATDKL